MSNPTGTGDMPLAAQLAAIFDEAHTARLVLRRPRADDADAMFAIHGDSATNRFNPYGPDPDHAASAATLARWREQWDVYGFGYWAVTLPADDEVIGFGGVRVYPWRERDILNLYYRFAPSAWGHGYATEVARTAVILARTYLPQWPVVARVRAVNVPSVRVATRSGLERAPELDDDHLIFALGWPAH